MKKSLQSMEHKNIEFAEQGVMLYHTQHGHDERLRSVEWRKTLAYWGGLPDRVVQERRGRKIKER